MHISAAIGGILLMTVATTNTADAAGQFPGVRQITNDLTTNHRLDMNHNFSPDGMWLVYDTRIDEMTTSRTIEKVHVETGEKIVLYHAESSDRETGTGIGAVSYFPHRDEVVFIHGLDNGLPYGFTRRTGAIVSADGSASTDRSRVRWADARDITPPFTPGALRGGTHRHDPGGPDGQWIGYTYNDAIMAAQGPDLRTLGVTRLGLPVSVDKHPENRPSEGFSAVITTVKPMEEVDPSPESDEIYRATDDQWIGTRGYQKPDGSWQIARAFIGHMRRPGDEGELRDHTEVFIVEIPEDITVPGPDGSLEGTETTFPAPPLGTVQRRLTNTQRGCRGLVRSTSDGRLLAFVSFTDEGSPQIFVMSPHNEMERAKLDQAERDADALRQVTSFPGGVREPARWLPDDIHFVTTTRGALVVVNARTGKWRNLTEQLPIRPNSLVVSSDGKRVAFNGVVPVDANDPSGARSIQIFVIDIVLPDSD